MLNARFNEENLCIALLGNESNVNFSFLPFYFHENNSEQVLVCDSQKFLCMTTQYIHRSRWSND